MAHKVRLFNRHWHLPQSKPIRIGLGILLVAGGLLGFLPVLGFWMIPLGLLVLSVDLPVVRRWRRQLTVWWHRRNGETAETDRRREGVKREGRLTAGVRAGSARGATERSASGRLEATTGIEPVCTDLQSMRQRHLINGLAANRDA